MQCICDRDSGNTERLLAVERLEQRPACHRNLTGSRSSSTPAHQPAPDTQDKHSTAFSAQAWLKCLEFCPEEAWLSARMAQCKDVLQKPGSVQGWLSARMSCKSLAQCKPGSVQGCTPSRSLELGPRRVMYYAHTAPPVLPTCTNEGCAASFLGSPLLLACRKRLRVIGQVATLSQNVLVSRQASKEAALALHLLLLQASFNRQAGKEAALALHLLLNQAKR
eukprot:1160488-Pelagomonas_calceolata.AAC.8